MNQNTASNKGFTLLELIIVMAIIGILAATVILNPGILDNRNKAIDTGNLDSATKLQQQLFTYYLTTNNTFPASDAGTLDTSREGELVSMGIISSDANIANDTFILTYSEEGTPNVGFKLTSTQFKTNSLCFDESLSEVECESGYFFVPASGRLGTNQNQ